MLKNAEITKTAQQEDKANMTPMIDVVFLLLIFFLWTTDPTQEADISIQLPVQVEKPPDQEEEVRDYVIEIRPSGEIVMNSLVYDSRSSREMPQLRETLRGLRETADKMSITIMADPDSLHQRTIDVLDAAAAAEVKLISFAPTN